MSSEAIQVFSPEFMDITVTRAASATSYLSGRAVAGATTSVTVRGSMTPATPDDLKRLPEEARTEEAMRIIAVDALYTLNKKTGFAADLVAYDGEQWEVQSVKRWPSYAQGMEHWDAVAVRLDREGV